MNLAHIMGDPWRMQIAMLPARREHPVQHVSAGIAAAVERMKHIAAENKEAVLRAFDAGAELKTMQVSAMTGIPRETVRNALRKLTSERFLQVRQVGNAKWYRK